MARWHSSSVSRRLWSRSTARQVPSVRRSITIADLVPIIAAAPTDAARRRRWLERLWDAHEADDIPYIESLGDYWTDLCASRALASEWADRLVGITRHALNPDPNFHGHFHGTSACLSALFSAQRHDEIVDILRADTIWPHKR